MTSSVAVSPGPVARTSPRLPRIIATDLDGTLVRGDETVSDYSVSVLRRARAAGATIVGVTGRGPRLLDLCRRDLPEADFFVLAQGAYVVDQRDPARPVVLRRDRMPGEDLGTALRLMELAAGEALSVLVEALDAPRSPLWGDPGVIWPYPEWQVYDRALALAGPVYKGFARAPGMTADQLLALARRVVPLDLAEVTQAGLGYVEITAPGVDKGTGLAVVAQAINASPLDAVVFGDMPNDGPMFRWAGRGVAVANAHPEILALAAEVTASNDADGVAAWVASLLDA
ncbi:HAD family hydrolase [Luedemannella helvata]|uniref:HAD family hydrolase n=1 Tax=Luedemannella helvata TaxID=349315 RepID=A0ABP4WMA4_9ACTN